MSRARRVFACLVVLGFAIATAVVAKDDPPASEQTKPAATAAAWAPAVQPKTLSENVKRGLAWLVEHQLPGGAWGQGEESSNMGGGGQFKDTPSVADTCAAALALVRAGSSPAQGEHAKSLECAVLFVCGEIEKSDADSLYVTATRGTRLQAKLGTYIDTFLASLLLAETRDKMPDDASRTRAAAALDKVLAKMQKHQRADGTWGDQGWATTLSLGMAVKGLNRAAQSGAKVDEAVREKAEGYAQAVRQGLVQFLRSRVGGSTAL